MDGVRGLRLVSLGEGLYSFGFAWDEACSSRKRHEAAEEVRAILAGPNSTIYGMMLACITQYHCAITSNDGASVHIVMIVDNKVAA